MLFQTALTNPGSMKSGEYLQDLIVEIVERVLRTGQYHELVASVKEWLLLRKDPETMLAVDAARAGRLTELIPEIASLRVEVQAGRVLWKQYVPRIDDALTALNSQSS